jgi:hypothetical protein
VQCGIVVEVAAKLLVLQNESLLLGFAAVAAGTVMHPLEVLNLLMAWPRLLLDLL